MGYEHKLIVVDVCENMPETVNGKRYFWGEKVATIEMGSVPAFFPLFDKTPTDCFYYADDGETIITEDMYGKPLGMASVEDVIKTVEKEIEEGGDPNYRRWKPLLGLLKGFDLSQWRNLVVLRFGH